MGRLVCVVGCAIVALLVSATTALAATGWTAFVANGTSPGSLTPFNTASGTPTAPIGVGNGPDSVAITPDGQRAFVVERYASKVRVINTATGQLITDVIVGSAPSGIAITPDGTTAYVTNYSNGTVTPINNASSGTPTADTSFNVGTHPNGIAITRDGNTMYVTHENSSGTVTTYDLTNLDAPGPTIVVGPHPEGIAITPDGTTAYVANFGDSTVTPITNATPSQPISIATSGLPTAGTPIPLGIGMNPIAIAIAPGGDVFVADFGSNQVTVIRSGAVLQTVTVGSSPYGVAVSPDGKTAFVANSGDTTVTPINTVDDTTRATIQVGTNPDAIAITPDQAPTAAFTATVALAGQPSLFDGSASTPVGTIASYQWGFGDGTQPAVTTRPTVRHTYTAAGNYTVTLTVTTTGGTSTTQVFTGQTMLNNGGPSATTNHAVRILKAQSISFTSTAASPTVGGSYVPAATSTSGLPVRFSIDPSTTNSACTITSGTVKLAHAGSCVIDANQAGNATYAAAPQAQQTVSVAAGTTRAVLTLGNLQLTLAIPATTNSCLPPGGRFTAALTKLTLRTGKATTFLSAALYLDRGAKHTRTVTVAHKRVTKVTYAANATIKRLPKTVTLSTAHLTKGIHHLTLVVRLRQTNTRHGKHVQVTITKKLSATITVC